jgi:ribonuclease HI
VAPQRSENRKLVVFVPSEALEAVRDAVFAAGAGRIGDYERCSWQTDGIGTFRPLPGANPAVGEVGEEERVPEVRLETVFPAESQADVVAALRSAHPYEEPAFDIYALVAVEPPKPKRQTSRRRRPAKARLFTDGGARGNPGPAAFGYVLEAEDGTVLASHGEAIGVATNNVAEYRGLIAGLAKAVELHVPEVEVVSDSELLVKQMRGEYKVRKESLQDLALAATRLSRQLAGVEYVHVPRARNELADQLVNEALDRAARD